MQSIKDFPFGATSVRLRAAELASHILMTVTEPESAHGNLHLALRLDPEDMRASIDPTAEKAEHATEANDVGDVVVLMDQLGGVGGVEDMVAEMGPDAPPNAHAILVRHFNEFATISQDLEDNGFGVAPELVGDLGRLQVRLNADLGQQ